jgi:hypothetical protein
MSFSDAEGPATEVASRYTHVFQADGQNRSWSPRKEPDTHWPMRRPEEILRSARSSTRRPIGCDRSRAVRADRLHPEVLREIAHYELELAVADVAA